MQEQKAPGEDIQSWILKISAYERDFKTWEGRTKKIIERYRDDRNTGAHAQGSTAKFNILWSNVETLKPAVFARLPKPDVSRRFSDNDPVGRVASLMLERALEFEIEHYPDYRAAVSNSVFDRFMGGRGVAWVRYEPHFKAAEQGMPEYGLQITEDADDAEASQEAQEEIDYECCPVDYVHWRDFGHVIARTWEEVPAVWRKVYMPRQALIKRFGDELGREVPLDTKPEEDKKQSSLSVEGNYQALIYEIWDKETNKAIWLSKSLNKILDERDDPLGLECFFPCPRPLFGTVTTEDLIPTPDFSLYQDQAAELDCLAERIDGLIQALKVRGVYDASVPELARLFTEGAANDLIPVKSWQAFSEKNGLTGAISLIDLKPIIEALNGAYAAMKQVEDQIYQIIGISDIMRGANEAAETATATRTKGAFGSLRLKHLQANVTQFATEILQIKAQIICKHFQPETIIQISAAMQLSETDQQLIQPALEMLKGDPMRNFRIEVSSDSMVQMDETQEKADRMEFLKAVGSFMDQALPMAQASPQMAPLMVELLKFGVTGFKVGKSVEGAIDQAIDSLKQEAANPQQKPDPEIEKVQAQAQIKQQELNAKTQSDMQLEKFRQQVDQQRMAMEDRASQQQAQLDAQVEQHKQQVQAQQIAHQNELESQREQQRAQNEAMLEQQRIASDAQLEQSRQQFELMIARLSNANKIEVAEINHAGQLELAQMAAANQASQDETTKSVSDSSPAPT